jgi:hypothetical protein
MRGNVERGKTGVVSDLRPHRRFFLVLLLDVFLAAVVVVAVIGSFAISDVHLPCPGAPCPPTPGVCPPCPVDHRIAVRVLLLSVAILALSGLIVMTVWTRRRAHR